MLFVPHQLTDEERADLLSFSAQLEDAERDLASILAAERSAAGQSWLATVRDFSERFLPSRGFRRVLVFTCGAGTTTVLLAERGYDVTAMDVDAVVRAFVRHRLERHGATAEVVDPSAFGRIRANFDAVLIADEIVPRTLGEALRRGGVLVSPAGVALKRRLGVGGLASRTARRGRSGPVAG